MSCCITLSTVTQAQPDIMLEQYVSGFSSPIDIAHAGDDRLFIVERSGVIKIIDANDTTLPTPFLDIEDIVYSFGGQGEIGLLGMEFHPDFANNGYFFVHYTNLNENSNISRFTVDPATPNEVDPATELTIMTINQPYLNHNGGCLKFGPDAYLYIGMGDGGSANDPQNRSQNTQSLLGKMLRIDIDNGSPYSIPADNPFVADSDVLDEIWAIGLRNPWRYSFDRSTGDLWIGDVGQGTREEINRQPASSTGGENYGWRCYEGFNAFNTSGCSPASDYHDPVVDYNHSASSCSVTGGYVYRGTQFPSLQGLYIYADYCSGRIWTLTSDGVGGYTDDLSATYSGYDISTFGEDAQGEMYLARRGNGTIYRIGVDDCSAFAANETIVNESCANANDGSITLDPMNGTGPLSYSWSNGNTTNEITGLGAATYSVSVTDANNCELIEFYEITNGTPTNLMATADGPLVFCEGGSVVLTSSEAPAGYMYQWNIGSQQIAGANEQTYTVTSGTGNYYVNFLFGPCSVPSTSNWIFVTVNETPDEPVIELEGTQVLCLGDVTSITAGEAPTDYGYQWYRNSMLITGETTIGLVISEPGNYYCVYTGECETTTSNWIEISEDNGPMPVISAVANTLSVNDVYEGYQWNLDGSPIFGANEPNYEATESGDYTVETMTVNNCSYTAAPFNVAITSVFPIHQLSDVVISPNPFTEKLSLNITVNEPANLSLRVHDVKGVQQYEEPVTVNQQLIKDLHLKDLPTGVYFLSIQNGDKVYTKKIIRE